MGRWEEALAAFRRFLELAPDHPQAAGVRESVQQCEAKLAGARG
jgi:hypothetical protein